MRGALRHLLLAFVAISVAVFGSGAAAATMIGTPSVDRVTAISPEPGTTVGIAHPVSVRFAAPVADKARAESNLHIRSALPLSGTYSWSGDSELTWTPAEFLPARSTITVQFGTVRSEFQTNVGVVAVGDMSAHTFTVSQGGQVVWVMPASFGKPGWETPVGTFPVLEKFRSVVFDSSTIGIPRNSSEGYYINGEYAERLTWGGVFVHSAPWSTDSQGYANVSHGCVNLAPEDAAWYYNNVGVGDPVTIHW
ncbi:L,D-transpeptidase [Nocardia bovistercoris]|uniref:L,D-transpeptidase n=1 Tax=Nocardia bovistercoris TaxID=2785916 RepID=A0A931I7C8_9NOCA|nr:L,D-transpeptidase [Nocardia bovistercoris]MBH0774760.1 L,D-transpeptidase [Nocardia bovistercoris]